MARTALDQYKRLKRAINTKHYIGAKADNLILETLESLEGEKAETPEGTLAGETVPGGEAETPKDVGPDVPPVPTVKKKSTSK